MKKSVTSKQKQLYVLYAIAFVVIVLFGSISVSKKYAASSDQAGSALVGSWGIDTLSGSDSITLNRDGSYQRYVSDGLLDSGTWKYSSDILTLHFSDNDNEESYRILSLTGQTLVVQDPTNPDDPGQTWQKL